MCECCCNRENDQPRPRNRRRFRPIRTVFHLLLLYGLLVFGGGTLINTGHPVAVETGRLIHTVTLVEPSIYWAHSSGYDALAGGLQILAHGVDLHQLI